MADTTSSNETVGTLELVPAGQIFKKGKAMTETNKYKHKDFKSLQTWIETKDNATKLQHSSNNTWIEAGTLRLDTQLISPTSPFYNCAIQLNTGGGAASKSESYSSVLIHEDCFSGAHITHLKDAVSKAHADSNAAGRIFHVVPAATTVQAPATDTSDSRTIACPLGCGATLPFPEYARAGSWGCCDGCEEPFEYPPELFKKK